MVTAPALFPCYAPSDAARVGALCDFLEQGAGVKIFRPDGEIGAGETILSKAEEALSADVILLCLSPAAIPPRWDRAQWEPVLFTQPKAAGVELATVLIEECKFPELLRRRNFFDLTRDPLPGFRLIKRWLLELRPPPLEPAFVAVPQPSFVGRDMEIEALQRRLADRPGVVTLAHPAPVGKTALAMEFVRRCAPEFQDVFWLSCGRRSIAGQAGDLAAQLGLRLPGDARTNLGALRDFCAPRRLLIVLDDVEERASIQLVPGGRCSALLTTRQSEFACGERIALEPVVPLTPRLEEDEDALARALQLSGAQEPAPLQRALDWALPRAGGQPEVYALATVLARRAIAVSTRQGRLAEAFEILERVIPIAEATQDWRLLEDLTREQIWILEAWDRLEEAAQRRWLLTSLEASQTTFDFS